MYDGRMSEKEFHERAAREVGWSSDIQPDILIILPYIGEIPTIVSKRIEQLSKHTLEDLRASNFA